jgi:anti-sigma-K factor RskA
VKLSHPALRSALASAWVLGTLRGPARRRFAAHLAADADLRRVVARWESFLTPLAESVPPVEPPARVWRAIEARIAPRPLPASASLWTSLAFWRWTGAGLATACVVLVSVMLGLRPTAPAPAPPVVAKPAAPAFVAVLSTPEQVARVIVEDGGAGALRLRVMQPWPAATENDLELWVLPKEGAPRSLGVVAGDRDGVVRPANLAGLLDGGVAFALSKEPRGGSPTGAPTGPVVCSGPIARARA